MPRPIYALAVALLVSAPAFAQEGVRAPPPPSPEKKPPQLTKAPQIVEAPPAEYPPEALASGTQADVACLVDIDAKGNVSNVTVEQGASPAFDAAAVAAIRNYKFTPAELDDVPAAVRIRYVYHFVIEQKHVTVTDAPERDPDAGAISGEVLEQGTRRPIAGADLRLEKGEATASSDGKGRFLLDNVAPGDVRVFATAPGFAEASARVHLDKRGRPDVILRLRRTVLGELSATVTGDKPHDAPTRRSLSHDELVNIPGALNDPIRAVQNLPGLNRTPFLGGALLVRGSAAADTGLYLDGDKIPLIFHFLGGPSVINEQMIDRIDFYPGGYGSYYGRNLTGALDVASRPGEGQGFHGSASIDLLQSVAFVETPLGESTRVAVAARRSYIDLFLPLVLPNNPKDGTTSIVPVYWDYQARVDHKFEGGDTLAVLLFGSDDNLAVVQTGGKRNQPLDVTSHIAFHRIHATYRHDFSSKLQLVIAPAGGWAVTSFTSSGAGAGTFAQSQSGNLFDTSLGIRGELRWQVAEGLQLRSGLDLLNDRYKVTADIQTAQQVRNLGLPITEELHLERTQPFLEFGEYVEADLRVLGFQIVPGLRLDQLHWLGHTRPTVDPRLWVRRPLTEDTSLKAYTGVYHQPPSALQVDPQVGNPELLPEWAAQFGAGVDQKLGPDWNLSAEVFYNRKGGLVYAAKPSVIGGQVFNPIYLNTGIGRAYGLEVLLRREVGSRWFGWLAYTLGRSEVLRVPGEAWRDFQFDQTHIFTLVAGYKPAVGWELSTRFRLVSGNPIAPVTGAVFDADKGTYTPEVGNFGDARSPLFKQLDARVQKTWTWELFQLGAYLDVQNVLNSKNEEFHVYDYRYRDQGSITGIPILPTLGVNARW